MKKSKQGTLMVLGGKRNPMHETSACSELPCLLAALFIVMFMAIMFNHTNEHHEKTCGVHYVTEIMEDGSWKNAKVNNCDRKR